MKRIIIISLIACCFAVSALRAQTTATSPTFGNRLYSSLDLGVDAGTTGVGIDVSVHPTSYIRVRAGVDYMPRFTVPVRFSLDSYRDGALSDTEFSELQEMMKQLTGFDVDQKVKMNCKANMVNFKLLVDFFPIRSNKHWYATAGFYWGSSRIGSAINAMEEMPTLLAIGMFNNMHDRVLETDYMETPIYDNIYLDPDVADRLKERMERMGRVGIHVGNYPDGRPYMMEPDKDGMVKADMRVNSFKPYLGLGYTTSFGAEKRVSFDAYGGVLFWGGRPRIITHENVDLANDVTDIAGVVGDYVGTARSLKVYPAISVRIAYRIGK